jgi:hypothetical protein
MRSKINSAALSVIVIIVCMSQVRAQTPQLVSNSPGMHELGVSTAANISVTFDIDMDVVSITDTSFFVVGNLMGRYTGTTSYDQPTHTLTFDPDADFTPGEIVTLTLTPGITSVGGEEITGFSFSFTVETTGGFEGLSHRTAFSTTEYEAIGINLVSADFNEDTGLDLAMSDAGPYFLDVLMLSNTGNRDFNVSHQYLTGGYNLAIAAADMDYDGDIDIISPFGDYEKAIYLRIGVSLNTGDGTFERGPTSNFEPGSASVFAPRISDFDCDGKMDVLWMAAPKIALGYYDEDYFFTNVPPEGYNFESEKIRIADIDNDGLPDIVLDPTSTNNMYALFNDGNRIFNEIPVVIAFDDAINDLQLSDFNGDGFIDIVVASRDPNQTTIFINNGDRTFSRDDGFGFDREPLYLAVGDLDGDSDIDIVVITEDEPLVDINILWNNGDAEFTTSVSYHLTNDNAYSPVIGDFNKDGNPDIAVVSRERSNVSIYWNMAPFYECGDANGDGIANVGDAVFLITYIFKFGPPPVPIEAGDANCDGSVNVGDAVYLVNFVFMKGPPPCCF